MTGNIDMSMMYAMHNALRRDLAKITEVSARTDENPRLILANGSSYELFKKALTIHHTAEDEALWPPLRAAVAGKPDEEAVLDAMEAEHGQIDPLLASVEAVLDDETAGPDKVAAATGALAEALTAHLEHEEKEALPLIDARLTQEQWQHYSEVHVAKTGPETSSLLPWLLEDANEDVVAMMTARMPENVRTLFTDQWVPAYRARDRWNAVS
ncbi:hemerythrin domain-containing protein [Streptomyces sp. MAR4 CNX-425]|uniref:hemerythrin domain-containing protein n=1 Tax=Streptomyces sp. MAR4 CNX-425 TaxID=3406343 RepID=UPI003B5153D4